MVVRESERQRTAAFSCASRDAARLLRNICTMRFGRLFKLALCGLLVALAVSSIHLWLKEKNYLFSEDVISKLGRDALKKHGTTSDRNLVAMCSWFCFVIPYISV